MPITLYEVAPTRSKRVRWALDELEVSFESISGMHLFGSDELKQVHPQGKIPAIIDDGRPLFEIRRDLQLARRQSFRKGSDRTFGHMGAGNA